MYSNPNFSLIIIYILICVTSMPISHPILLELALVFALEMSLALM
jgi:hypothetical protein